MRKFITLIVLGSLALICMGGYELFIEFGNSAQPTEISIAALEKAPPFNRNIIITGAHVLSNEGLRFWRTKYFNKVAGSEVLFLPLEELRLAGLQSFSPSVVLLVREPEIKEVLDKAVFDPSRIPAVRITNFSLESIAEKKLIERYGESAVDKMIVVEYKRKVKGMSEPLGQMALGFMTIVGLMIYSVHKSGAPK